MFDCVYLRRCPAGETFPKSECFVYLLNVHARSRVTARVPVLKTTRSPYSNRRCCHIRVFQPYLTAPSPRLIISWRGLRAALVMHYWPSAATSAGMTALRRTICYPTGLVSLHLPEILDLLFICGPAGAQQSLAGRPRVQFRGILCRFDPLSLQIFSSDSVSVSVVTNNCLFASFFLSFVCIPQKWSFTPEWWNVQRPDGPQWQPLYPWKHPDVL